LLFRGPSIVAAPADATEKGLCGGLDGGSTAPNSNRNLCRHETSIAAHRDTLCIALRHSALERGKRAAQFSFQE